jgi:uncharacterized BrkB/YihY/UPF0761 family membrane protein
MDYPQPNKSPEVQPRSFVKQLLRWLFTTIAVVLFMRLILLLMRVGWMVIEWLVSGDMLEQLPNISFSRLAVNIAIVITLTVVFKWLKEKVPTRNDASQ